jgi:uncharacterized nucleotidyltransferase DUF6036
MTVVPENLWRLARSGQPIDATALAAALEEQARDPAPDFRTRLLVRDSLDALARHWGREQLEDWIAASPARGSLHAWWGDDLGPAGFPTLERRIMDAVKPETVLQFLRELGRRIQRPSRVEVGGSIALILQNVLSRHTDDIDVVNEVPAEIRSEHALLDELAARFGLRLTHFQSHYLPTGWETRLSSFGGFGQLDVYLIDPTDVFVGKLFSARRKDRDDLRALAGRLDKQAVRSRLRTSAGALLAEPQLAEQARENWYIVYGEELPA